MRWSKIYLLYLCTALFFIFLSISLVSSEDNICPGGQDQAILSLFSSTDSQVSSASYAPYTYKVCYDQVFGKAFTGFGYKNGCMNLKDEGITGRVLKSDAGLNPGDALIFYRINLDGLNKGHIYTTNKSFRDELFQLAVANGIDKYDEGNVSYLYNASRPQPANTVPLYSAYLSTGFYFYTTNVAEFNGYDPQNQRIEGYIIDPSTTSSQNEANLYRFLRPSPPYLPGDHFYTINEYEREYVLNGNQIVGSHESSLINTHVFNVSLGINKVQGYPENYFCYGDLKCNLVRASSCPAGTNETLQLSAEGNAMANAPKMGNYAYRVCCSSIFATTGYLAKDKIGAVYWADRIGSKFDKQYVAYNGDKVYLYANTDAVDGSLVKFDIYRKDGTNLDAIGVSVDAVVDRGVAKTNWTIKETDFSGSETNQYFVFNASSSVNNNLSSVLNVSKSVRPNDPPTAFIASPGEGVYYANTTLNFVDGSFTQGGADPEVTWSISDNSLPSEKVNLHNFEHSLNTTGQKRITLTARYRDKTDVYFVDLLVISSPGIFGKIRTPSYNQQILANSLRNTNVVQGGGRYILGINGNKSFVIDSTTTYPNGPTGECTTTARCLIGDCPTTTMNCPLCSPAGCQNIAIENTPRVLYTPAKYSWANSENPNLFFESEVINTTVFTDLPDNQNSAGHWVKLNMSYIYDENNLLNVLTSQSFKLVAQCSNSGRDFLKLKTDGSIDWNTDSSTSTAINITACRGPNNIVDGGGDDCCPAGQVCSENGCVIRSEEINYCEDYDTSASCSNADNEVISNTISISGDSNCGQIIEGTCEVGGIKVNSSVICSCGWSEAESKCYLQENSIPLDQTSTCPVNQLNNYICRREPIKLQEDSGLCTFKSNVTCISSTGVQVGQDYCGGEEKCKLGISAEYTVPCGRPTIELPFFDMKNMFFGLIGIIFIYIGIFFFKKRIIAR
jgi:hypothetical protein